MNIAEKESFLDRFSKTMNIWFGDPDAYFLGRKGLEPPPKILGVRRMEHSDLSLLEQLIRPETYDIFGEINLGRIYEASCLSVVQWNEKRDVVSGVCLCNYPNVPSVTPQDWPTWFDTLYGVEDVTERNAMFVHFLVWDKRYTGHFFEDLLTGLFDVASCLLHVILVLPPRVIPADVFEHQMIRVPSKCLVDTYSVQALYVTVRHLKNSRLRIRRVVEEDNDEVIPIIDAETNLLKEFYGEYYISEMVRYPNDYRQLIVSEDDEGLANGVMFLNRRIDVETLNENFELGPYNGLRKPHEDDAIGPESMEPVSETFFPIFFKKPREETTDARFPMIISAGQSVEDSEETTEPSSSSVSIDPQPEKEKSVEKSEEKSEEKSMEKLVNFSDTTFLSDLPSIADYISAHYRSKIQTGVFEDTFYDIPRKSMTPMIEATEELPTKEIQLPPRPIYRGEVNAFTLEVFAMQEQLKNRWSKNFLETAFECFPEMDYLAILLPFAHSYLPFLEHFVRVPLRCNKDYPKTLYVTHRAALHRDVKAREGGPGDREDLLKLIQRIPKAENILIDFDAAVRKQRPDLYCYVFRWNDTIVGVAILCNENDATYVRRRYHVEDYISTKNVPQDAYGRIVHFVLMPIFSIHLRFIFCEMTRLSGLTVLYYRLTESASSALTRTHPLVTCLNAMIFVNPRRRIEYKFRGCVETDELETEEESFALFMTTPRLAMLGNVIIDTKIVVVGASDCGVALIEHLALGCTADSMRFVNLTLISPNGFPFENERSPSIACMIPFLGRYCRDYRRLVAARAWINVVYGTVVTINRKEKYVTVMNQGNITYDYLILTCGLQYQKPRFQEDLEAQKRGEFTERETPWNCLTINDDAQAATCLEKIQLLTSNFENEKKIVFYGHSIDCYCALQGLLESGIDGSWITLIEPPLHPCDTHESVFFNDCEVNVETMNSISKSGVKILLGWKLIDWHLRDSTEGKMIEGIVLRSKGETRTLECDALVNFDEKTIDTKIFLAICKSGLVFDGQLVIDPEFRTNDPSIFAAGTITKYCRKFFAESWQHKYYNAVEIGERLATIFPSIIDAQHRGDDAPFVSCKSKTYLTLPSFRSAIIVACTLPGGYRYLHVRKPGKTVPRKMAIRYNIYGSVLVTGSCTSEIGYFRIRLNRFDSVETITCFSRKDFEVRQTIALYGKHESLLNELKTRYQKSLISDFYAYFREPWAMAIFYDRFECLRVENRATLLSKTAIPGQSLIDDCVRALMRSKWEPMLENDRRRIEERYADSVYQLELEENLMDFLQFSEEDVPVYCTPGKLRELYADIEDSPLYSEL